MVTIDPKLSQTAQDNLWIINIKTGIIRALKAALDDQDYPDKKIQGIKISMEYPLEQNLYPHIWVKFSFTKLQQAGIAHMIYEDNALKEEWYFEGNVTLTIMALSSYERDIYSSQLIQLLAFGSLNPIARKFQNYLHDDQSINITPNKDSLIIGGQSENVGAPWDTTASQMSMVYEDNYTFNTVGQFKSTFQVEPGILSGIIVTSQGVGPNNTDIGLDPIVEEFNGNPWQ